VTRKCCDVRAGGGAWQRRRARLGRGATAAARRGGSERAWGEARQRAGVATAVVRRGGSTQGWRRACLGQGVAAAACRGGGDISVQSVINGGRMLTRLL
jgi:hypothetical protein